MLFKDEMATPSAYLAKRKKRYPPLYPSRWGLDVAQRLYGILEVGLPDPLRELVACRTVVVGEIGRNHPEIQTIIRRGTAVIEFNSGMMDFVFAVIRTLGGNMVRHTRVGRENEPAQSVPDVAAETAKLFKQWKWPNRYLWTVRRINYPPFNITRNVHATADHLAMYVELFMLAHEFGHVAIEHGLYTAAPSDVETVADFCGYTFMSNLAKMGRVDPALVFGGSVLAIRICAGLERIGVRFSQAYPKQHIRLEKFCRNAQVACPSIQFYHELSRIGYAYNDQMDDVETHFGRRRPNGTPAHDRLLVKLIAMLMEVAMERMSSVELIQIIVSLNAQTPRDVMGAALCTLHAYYVAAPPNSSFIDNNMRQSMGQILVRIQHELPPSISSYFVTPMDGA
jgi:hypothetical protein